MNVSSAAPILRKMAATLILGETLTASEAAELLGELSGVTVSPATVRRLADRGDVPAFRLTPRSPRRFRREDLEALVARALRPEAA